MAGATFTQTQRFGCSGGPTYQGSTSVAPPVGGVSELLIDADVLESGGTTEIYGDSITFTKILAYGFLVTLVDDQGNANPSINIQLQHAAGGMVDVIYNLTDGQQISFTDIGDIVANVDAIIGDSDGAGGGDFRVQGIVHVAL
jgi:hypothetical protein